MTNLGASASVASTLAELKPEAVCFSDNNGQRAGYILLDLADAPQIPTNAVPWMLAFNANIELHPRMIPDDLAKAAGGIE